MKKVISITVAAILLVAIPLSASATTGSQEISQNGRHDLGLLGGVETANVMSVVIPTTIDFTIRTKADGRLDSVISGDGTITNNSNTPINVDIVGVSDPNNLLSKLNVYLVPSAKSKGVLDPYKLTTEIADDGTKIRLADDGLNGIMGHSTTPETLIVNVVGEAIDSDITFSSADTYNLSTVLKVTQIQ